MSSEGALSDKAWCTCLNEVLQAFMGMRGANHFTSTACPTSYAGLKVAKWYLIDVTRAVDAGLFCTACTPIDLAR